MSESKRIVKNTMFLYIRMFLIMGITLYTSRIVLNELGISDYGIYSLVGGIVMMIGFFNAAMSSATQRYLSFDIGKGDLVQLKKTFSTTLTIHVIIAVIGLILAETVGLWYVNYKMIFPEERVFAVNVVYQFSVFTFLLNIIQVPYNALIIARERMNMYAYVSILEALLKLTIVFILVYFGSDKLITYSVLTFIIALIIRITYQIYCRKEFKESHYIFQYDQKYFKELIHYSGWNLFGNIASIAKGQGVNIVLNLFFGTAINATYGITNQVFSAVSMFASNFQLALNPQIIQNYSKGNIQQSQTLIAQGSKFSFFLMLILISPIILNTDYILQLWLKTPPEHTKFFIQLCLVNLLIDCLSNTLMVGAQATGQIKWYQIVVGTLVFLNLPLSYLVLNFGFAPSSVYIVSIGISLVSLQFRLYFLKKVMRFNVRDYYFNVLSKAVLLTCLSATVVFIIKKYSKMELNFLLFFIETMIVIITLIFLIVLIGINKKEKELVGQLIKTKIKK